MENPSLILDAPRSDISFATEDLPGWQQKAIKTIEGVVGKKRLMQKYREFLEFNEGPEEFWDDVVECLKLQISCFGRDLSAVPKTGPLVIVANHPFGLVDGAAICWLLSQRRKDFKVVLWDVFDIQHNGQNYFLPLDLSEDCKQARRQNLRIRKTAIEHLRSGKSVLIFPSGSAERSGSPFGKPYELPWLPFTEKMILASGASVLPIFVHGHNSRLFHVASNYSETLRLALFFYEINRKINTEVELSVGDVIQYPEIASWPDGASVISRLRDKTLALASARETATRNRFLMSSEK